MIRLGRIEDLIVEVEGIARHEELMQFPLLVHVSKVPLALECKLDRLGGIRGTSCLGGGGQLVDVDASAEDIDLDAFEAGTVYQIRQPVPLWHRPHLDCHRTQRCAREILHFR